MELPPPPTFWEDLKNWNENKEIKNSIEVILRTLQQKQRAKATDSSRKQFRSIPARLLGPVALCQKMADLSLRIYGFGRLVQ